MDFELQEKYILYGASFNPPHIGHFSAISQMLEEYDKVIVFPYPKKFYTEKEEVLPPIIQRLKMLELFAEEFFPQMIDRLLIVNLASEIKKVHEENTIVHTYDYLNFVKKKIPENVILSVCLGFDAQNFLRKEKFYNEELMKKEYPHFFLQEENSIRSEDLRNFFSNHNNIKSQKDEKYIRSIVGNALAEYIFKNNLYGLKNKNFSNSKKIKL